MPPNAQPASRPRNAAATRQDILDSARRLFARESYEQVGLRDIAAGVGVDPALVCRYFGSKEDLFKQALRGSDGDLLDGVQKQQLAAHLIAMVMGEPASRDGGEPPERAEQAQETEQLMMLLRSASSPRGSAIVNSAIHQDLLDPIAAIIGGPGPQLRAALAIAMLLGIALLNPVLSDDRIDRVELGTALHEVISHILNG